MNINDCAKIIKALGKAKSPVSVCIWGDPGSGKSARVKALAKELNYSFVPMIASQREAVDMIGLPYIKSHKYKVEDSDEVRELTSTSYHPPEWFCRAATEGKMILFLDEFNRARADVRNAAFELINERRLNNIEIRDSVIIVLACNPADTEGRNAVQEFDHAMVDRLLHLQNVADFDLWKAWAVQKKEDGSSNVHPDVVDFLNGSKAHFTKKFEDTHTFPVQINQTGRSWERASYVHSIFEQDEELAKDPHRKYLELEAIKGAVGPEIAMSFMQHLDAKVKPFTAEDVFKMSKETKAGLKKLTDQSNRTEMRLDVLKATMNNVIKAINDDPKEAHKYEKEVLIFTKMLNDESMRIFIQGIVDHANFATLFLEDEEINRKLNEIHDVLSDAEKAGQAEAANIAAKKRK
jgi:hypothetical protein